MNAGGKDIDNDRKKMRDKGERNNLTTRKRSTLK